MRRHVDVASALFSLSVVSKSKIKTIKIETFALYKASVMGVRESSVVSQYVI